MRVSAWYYSFSVVGVLMLAAFASGDVFEITYAGNTSYGYSDLDDLSMTEEASGDVSNNPFLGFALTSVESTFAASSSDSTNDTQWGSSSIQAFGSALTAYEGASDADYKSISKSKSIIEFTVASNIDFILDVEATSTAQDSGNKSKGSLINSHGLIVAEWNSLDGRNFQFAGQLEAGESYRLVAIVRSRIKDGMDDGFNAEGSFDLTLTRSAVAVPLPSAGLFGFAGLACLGLVPRRRRT